MSRIRTPSDRRAIPYLDAAMRMPRSRPAPSDDLFGRRNDQLSVLAVLLLYVVIRLLAWHAAALVEDHGSISQLFHAKVFATFDPRQILQLEPDTTPFYSFLVALFGLPGWSLETAARLCSLAFSVLLFVAVLRIGLRIAGPWATVAGLVLLSLNPVLARLAPAILTEPSYVATVYLGLWLFWRQYERPSWRAAAVLGVVFGLAFLNRVEALLFLPAIPLFQAVHYWGSRPRRYEGRQVAGWAVAFVAGFVLLAGPQVGWASWRLGRLAFNGRQVWSAVMANDAQSYERQIYGLDYSPSVTNLTYLQSHPESAVHAGPASTPVPAHYAHLLLDNTKELIGEQLGVLPGYFVCGLFLIGLLALIARRQRGDALLVIGFLGITLAGPLLHNVVARHILVIAPLMLLVAGIGVVALAERLAEWTRVPRSVAPWAAGTLVLVAGLWMHALRHAFDRSTCNREYCIATIERVSAIVRAAEVAGDPAPRISARKQYLAYFADGIPTPLPYTDYQGLVHYLRVNHVQYLFLESWQIEGYPFLASFPERSPRDFVLLDRVTDPKGRQTELYRLATVPAGPELSQNQ